MNKLIDLIVEYKPQIGKDQIYIDQTDNRIYAKSGEDLTYAILSKKFGFIEKAVRTDGRKSEEEFVRFLENKIHNATVAQW